jgi:hypothetical protein
MLRKKIWMRTINSGKEKCDCRELNDFEDENQNSSNWLNTMSNGKERILAISVSGISIFENSLWLSPASDCVIYDCRSSYISHSWYDYSVHRRIVYPNLSFSYRNQRIFHVFYCLIEIALNAVESPEVYGNHSAIYDWSFPRMKHEFFRSSFLMQCFIILVFIFQIGRLKILCDLGSIIKSRWIGFAATVTKHM